MSGEFEAAGAITDAAIWSRTAEPVAGEAHDHVIGNCLNCGTPLAGPHCHSCGQAGHVHRSISAFWHDILHSVLHFDGKFWNTLPLLVWKPGELTRRYIEGERAKFISPMALFLFAIFMMFAIFSYIGSPNFTGDKSASSGPDNMNIVSINDWRSEMRTAMADLEAQVIKEEAALALLDPASDEHRTKLNALSEIKNEVNGLSFATEGRARYPDALQGDGTGVRGLDMSDDINTGWPVFDNWLRKAIKKANKNPDLLLYKLQSNGYKFAWLLIPLSIPFVWLVTIGKRGHRFYDHAVFTTYSIAFMSLLFIVMTLSVKFNILPDVIIPLAVLFAPFHMYRQLRHAYGSSRLGAVLRLSLLLLFTSIVALLFLLTLITLGLIG
ncbi:DUF3667 domain-containing protein [Blastomonas sp.]|uniref:DUF3667 domain-containing protein n=1 Tax=Blastomonas sp. TaxID=1909299 RepID=UPI003594896F